jgi:hypothetical protein
MSVSVTFAAGLSSLPDDVLRALATFVPLSDLLVLVRCSQHFRIVLESQLHRCLDRLFFVTHTEEHWVRAQRMRYSHLPNQPEQRVLEALFGEASGKASGCSSSRVHCFVEVDGQSILSLHISHKYATYYICGKNQSARDRFASWLRYQCEQQLATEAYGSSMDIISGVTTDF